MLKGKLPHFASQTQRDLGEEGLSTWKAILSQHKLTREQQIIDLFHRGLEVLNINENEIPDLKILSDILYEKTGWKAIFVDGYEEGNSFYPMLAQKIYPVGNFIRDKKDLSYTPAPDIVHDLYGHLPFLADKEYADFCHRLGQMSVEFMDREDLFRQFERFFWFTIEFALVKTPNGNRIFGAGIASSVGECEYALSGKPKLLPFDVDVIRKREFYIDDMQDTLFLLENKDQLYKSLDYLYQQVLKDK
ncbi:MAG: hypothetical protein KDD50_13500 [Bdellovibrionales bacterium]|nr:hypothetical protein [Bdellovibrionales bacterium]